MHSSARARAFTLIELLVVLAIIAVLIGLILPAIQRVRATAARMACQNNLKQLALAGHNYHDSFGHFPPGLHQPHPLPSSRFTSLFVELLPFIEQQPLYERWDFANPTTNTLGEDALASQVLPILVCPSSPLYSNPLDLGGNHFAGVTTYGGNTGTWIYPNHDQPPDGIFFETGPRSRPVAGRRPVRMLAVKDGASNTFLLGERVITDGNLDSWINSPLEPEPDPPLLAMSSHGIWAPWGPWAHASLLLSTFTGINYAHPERYIPPPPPIPPQLPMPPPPVPWGDLKPQWYMRLSAFGSVHEGGANFARVDGSVRFFRNQTSLSVVYALGTRAGNEVFSLD